MKHFAKIALGAVMVAGAAAAVAQPASAAVSFGIGIGPNYYGPPAAPVCDPYNRYYNPYYCTPAYYNYGYGYAPTIGFWSGWGDRDRDWRRG
ncbi:MAG: hypothetical protein ACREFW_00445 [Rhizomicrobium sp.]